MKPVIRHLLLWSPRVICILYVSCFLTLFALDEWSGQPRFWDKFQAVLIHLSPAVLIVAVLILAWKWEWIGAIVFSALGIAYMILVPGHPDWVLEISGPLFLIGILFFVSWLFRKDIKVQH